MRLPATVLHRLTIPTALVAAVALYAYAFSAETPVGGLRGRVVVSDTGQPLAGVPVTVRPAVPTSGSDSRRVKTDSLGFFEVTRLPAGAYELETATEAYVNTPQKVAVREGDMAAAELKLKPGDPYLNLNIHQHAHLPEDNPRVALNGFRQGDEIKLRLLAVDDTALLRENGGKLREMLAPVPTRGTPLAFRTLRGGSLRTVREWGHPVRQRNAEGVFYDFERLGRLAPGVYVVEALGAAGRAAGWLMVTDLALVTKSAEGRALAFTADLRTGKPVPGVALSVFRGSTAPTRATTDARGIADLRLSGAAGENAELIARKGRSIAFSRFYPFGWDASGRKRYRMLPYTDRPVYRPGHKVRFKGVVRRLEGVGYSVPSSRSLDVEVRDGQDTVLFEGDATMNERGSFAGELSLPREAQGGSYTLSVKIDGEEHTDTFAVASYRKPEWRVDVETPRKSYVRGERVPVMVRATYYYGAPVVEGKVRYTVYRSRYWAWAGEDEELAPDEGEGESGAYGEVVETGEAATDKDGVARFEFGATAAPDEEWSEGYEYSVEAEVADMSDRIATGKGSVRVLAGELSLDSRPARTVAAPGESVAVTTAAKDLEGNPAAGVSLTVTASLDLWTGGRSEERVLSTQTVTTDAQGKAELPVQLPEAGLVTVKVAGSDRRGNRIDSSASIWVSTADGGDLETRYPALSVIPDKKRYAIGETASVLVNTDKPGATAIVALEAEEVLTYQLVPLKSKSTVVRFPIRAGYEPNVFVTACFVRGREFASSSAALSVNAEVHRLKVEIESDREVYQPGETAVYRIRTTDRSGRGVPAEVSFGVVDEAVYAIRPEPGRGLWETFYPRRRNEVATEFSYPEIYLGDADKDGGAVPVRKEFPDTAHWSAFVVTDRSGRATVQVTLPDSLTSWRATAVGHTARTEVGRATHNIRVAKELTLRLQSPRSATEGDRLTLSAVAHNYSAGPLEVVVDLKAAGLSVQGDTRRPVRLAAGAAERVTWDVTASTPGSATLSATAVAGALSDGMQLTLPVRAFARQSVHYGTGAVTADAATEKFDIDPAAVSVELELRLAPTLAGSLLGAMEYLATYPHGCTEQTMSSFMPNLVLMRTLSGLGLQRPELQNRLPEMTQAGLLRLYRYQHPDGGWGWWEHDETDPWMTSYVLFGLTQARAQGLKVNAPIYDNALSAAKSLADDKKLSPDNAMFLAYTLATAGATEPALKLLARFDAQSERLQRRSQGYRALAYAAVGGSGSRRAAAIVEALWGSAERTAGLAHWSEAGSAQLSGVPLDLESTAVILKAALTVDPRDPRLAEVVRWLLIKRNGKGWQSTRDTAWILFALADYLQATGELRPEYHLEVLLNGREVHSADVGATEAPGEETVIRLPLRDLAPQNELIVRKSGRGTAYYALQVTQEIRTTGFTAESTVPGLAVEREYFRLETRRDANGRLVVLPEKKPVTALKVGDRVMVRLRIQTAQRLEYMMLEDPLPPGCEAQDRGDLTQDEWSYWWSHMDIRDDRVNIFVRNLEPGKPAVIEYYLRPETVGSLRVLPAVLTDMYVPAIRAATGETRLEVTK